MFTVIVSFQGVEEGVYTCIGENFGEVGGIQLLDGVYLPSLVVPKLLYSAAGISRSSTMVIAYLMTVSTLTAEEALCVVRYCRKIANPNYGFMKQLKEYEETTLARVSGQGSMVKGTFKNPSSPFRPSQERVRVRAKGCVQEDEEQLRALLSEAKRPVTK